MTHHPDDETLRLFAVGRLTERQGDEIEKHLDDCETCTHRLDEIERKKTDPLFGEIKAAELYGNRVEPSGDFVSGGLLDDRYRLETLLGRGGMGEAWKAYDETGQRHVVLKFVPKDVQNVKAAMEAVLESFGHVEKLQHQHICPLYVIDNDPEHGYFLVMKFIDGLPLGVYQRVHGPMPLEEIVRILRDVADALDYAHRRKVIHRDVKPANIMIGTADGVQLIDFGLADEIRAALTRTENVSVSKISGTRSYMAPEQWEGRKQDARTDQYSLAVTAYELIAGHVPFSGADTEILRHCVLHSSPAPIPDVPEYVNAALLKGLAKNRNERFDNCKAFVEALGPEYRLKMPPPLPVVKKKSVAVIRIGVLLLLAVITFFVIRYCLKPVAVTDVPGIVRENIDASPKVVTPLPKEEGIEIRFLGETKPSDTANSMPTQEDFALARELAIHRNRITGVRKVIRVTVMVDEKGSGRLFVKRGLSIETLNAFRGTEFASQMFRNTLAFHGKNHSVRYLFLNGDMSRQDTDTVPPGWDYWHSGEPYNVRNEKTRFATESNVDRAGFSIGKQGGGLPCVAMYEVLDNRDDPPYFEMIFYKNYGNRNEICTLACWGVKDEAGLIRMSAVCTDPLSDAKRTILAGGVTVESDMSFFKQFSLPSAVKDGGVGMVKFGLQVHRTAGQRKPAGFDLTLFDMLCRFDADVGQW